MQRRTFHVNVRLAPWESTSTLGPLTNVWTTAAVMFDSSAQEPNLISYYNI